MSKTSVARRVATVAAVVGAVGAFGAGPAHASAWIPCDSPAIGPWCDAVDRQVANALTEVEAAKDYAVYVGDTVIREVNEAYATVRCEVLGECG